MKCPNCNETLIMADRQGVEVDYCPKCRGVWLDRGELDKIIERSAAYTMGLDTPYDDDNKNYQKSDSYKDQHYNNNQH